MKDRIISIDQGNNKKSERIQVWTEDAHGKKQYTELELEEESQTSATCAFSKACVMRGPRWTEPMTGKKYCMPHSRDVREALRFSTAAPDTDRQPATPSKQKSTHWSKATGIVGNE